MKEKVLVAMSGGVDSSVAAAILLEEGYEPVGVTMRLWNQPEGVQRQGCCSLDDVNDARRVAEKLGIPHYTLNMKDAFKVNVVEYFVDEYKAGRTPNPCIACNRVLKFEMLIEKGAQMGIHKLATGHYARVVRDGERYLIARGADRNKDQSYFLFDTPSINLSRILFPIGELTKEETREKAKSLGLKTAMKAESQEICFVPDDDYKNFMTEYGVEPREGSIVTADGKVVGKHMGTHFYTIGQRRGLGVGHAHRLYVTAIHPETNTVVVGSETDLHTVSMTVENLTWHLPVESGDVLEVQIRYRQEPIKCRVEDTEQKSLKVIFMGAVGAVAPGQAAVFYRGDIVIGGGWIASSSTS